MQNYFHNTGQQGFVLGEWKMISNAKLSVDSESDLRFFQSGHIFLLSHKNDQRIVYHVNPH